MARNRLLCPCNSPGKNTGLVQHIEEDFDKTIQAILKGEQTGGGFDLDGDFYGDSEYDQDEFDLQGFNDDFSDDF